jgi:pyridoxine/pyridoxamine 5'-phosphate oxidase
MPAPPLPSYYDDLPATLDEAWGLLVRGAVDRRHAFHTPTVATVGLDGTPRIRTVVLRAVDARARTFRFHTDRRSCKFAELTHAPAIALHAYDPGAKVQIRLSGTAVLHPFGSDLAASAWRQSQAMSRLCYGQIAAPGSTVDDPQAALEGATDEAAERNFVAVLTTVTRLEWLYLAHAGHRRALFSWESDTPSAVWLAP